METLAILLITEIMYNPASNERPPAQTEWVEIYNPGHETIDLAGWFLKDEDGQTEPFPQGTHIEPGEAVVLIPAEQTVEDFRAAWGEGFQVIPVQGWNRPGMHGLANSPSSEQEQLMLCRPDGSAADGVDFDDADPWPSDSPDGASIYLLPGHLDPSANDDGTHWARSEPDVHGARHPSATDEYSPEDVGSPGTVATE